MTAFRTISSCSPDLQRPLFRNVLLSGGTGSSPSLRARMQRELSALVSPTTNVRVGPCPLRGAGISEASEVPGAGLARRAQRTEEAPPELTFQWGDTMDRASPCALTADVSISGLHAAGEGGMGAPGRCP